MLTKGMENMKITQGSLAGNRARIVKDIFKGNVLQVAGKTYVLSSDISELHILSKEESRSAGQMFLILLLGITIIGLIIAIPMLIAHKKIDAQMAIKMTDGTAFVAHVDRAEWKALLKYQTAKLPEGFKVS